jgi:hypothetical protein
VLTTPRQSRGRAVVVLTSRGRAGSVPSHKARGAFGAMRETQRGEDDARGETEKPAPRRRGASSYFFSTFVIVQVGFSFLNLSSASF